MIGSPTIAAGATCEVVSACARDVLFSASTGTLKLDQASSFSGTVAGMSGQDSVDFANISFATVQQASYTGTSSGGILNLTDGVHSANMAMLGDYLNLCFRHVKRRPRWQRHCRFTEKMPDRGKSNTWPRGSLRNLIGAAVFAPIPGIVASRRMSGSRFAAATIAFSNPAIRRPVPRSDQQLSIRQNELPSVSEHRCRHVRSRQDLQLSPCRRRRLYPIPTCEPAAR